MRGYKGVLVVVVCVGWIAAMLVGGQEATEAPTPDYSECPELVTSAVTLTKSLCEETGLNQICYGHLDMEVQPRWSGVELDFAEPGDIAEVVDIQSLELSAMDVDTGRWGMVLIQVEVINEDGSVSDEDNVQILLFGDVQLSDALTLVQVTALDDLNIRPFPSTNRDPVFSLTRGQQIIANARLEDNSWLRVRLPGRDAGFGWLLADFVTSEEDIDSLYAISLEDAMRDVVDDRAPVRAMEAFYFQSGVDDSPCPEAPESGLLIQTPEGKASVKITIDGVVIQTDGTVAIRANQEAGVNVFVIGEDDTATIEANGETSTAVGGTMVNVSLDSDMMPDSIPSAPEAYPTSDVDTLPVGALGRQIDIAESATIEQGVPFEGSWLFLWNQDSRTCGGETTDLLSAGVAATIRRQPDGGLLWNNTPYAQVSPGVYTATYTDGNGNLHQDTLYVNRPDWIEGEKTIDMVSPVCTVTVTFRIRLVSASSG